MNHFLEYKSRMSKRKGLEKEVTISRNSLESESNFYKPLNYSVFDSFENEFG